MRLVRLSMILAVPLLTWNCGSTTSEPSAAGPDSGPTLDASSNHDGAAVPDGASAIDSGVADASDAGRSDASAVDASTCVEDVACATNAGQPCLTGHVHCVAGQAECVDGPPASDGTACNGGLCALGACLAPQTVGADVDLSAAPVTTGRTCAEAPSFAVAALTATQATLASAPGAVCFAPGDEVLMIDLQGSTGATVNVGNWELLRIKTAQGTTLEFASPKTKSYGAADGSDTGVGTGATDQKVAIVRVPRFGELTIGASSTLTSGAWNGATGGVLALRAAKLTVDGTIRAGGGYRPGRWSRDDGNCTENVATETGESIAGPPIVSTSNQFGAPGGLSAGATSFNANTPISPGAGHATAGEAGKNANGRTLGTPGAVYGVADATRLTMGSGASGNLTCEVNFAGPALVEQTVPLAGGIVVLLSDELDVGAAGIVSASATEAPRDVSASGGYVFIRGTTLHVGADRVSALGGTGSSPNGPSAGQTVKSGDGYVVLDGTTVTGTTTPVANAL
jgi:hypothetical protein